MRTAAVLRIPRERTQLGIFVVYYRYRDEQASQAEPQTEEVRASTARDALTTFVQRHMNDVGVVNILRVSDAQDAE